MEKKIEKVLNLTVPPEFHQRIIRYQGNETMKQGKKIAITKLIKDAIDENRFEQELLYYSEKLDISEEKVRLKSHLDYFNEMLELSSPIGKKLGFITQEIGREINTIGSKANDAGVQKIVVQMKEELEKIKEQSFNIL